MLSMLDHFQNRIDTDTTIEKECSRAKSILLMSEKNAVHAVHILRYLEHTEAPIPPELHDFTAGIQSAKEDIKHGRDLCQYLKAYGACKKTMTCQFRHYFNPEMDLPRRIADNTLPAGGEIISIMPLFIVDAACYFGRIVHKEDPYAALVKEMSEFYANSNNRVSVEKVEKLALCGLPEGLLYHRVQVLEIYPKEDDCLFCTVQVNYIDEGRHGKVKDHNLLHLPTKFHSLPPQALEFIVCRVKPIDNETDWNPKVTRYMNLKIKGKVHEAKVVLSMGNTVFIDPMVHVIKLVDLKTSINEYNVRSEILSTGMGVDNPEHVERLQNLCRVANMSSSNNEYTSQNVDPLSKSNKFQNSTTGLQDCITFSKNCCEPQTVEKTKHDVVDDSVEKKTVVDTPMVTTSSDHKSFHPEIKWFQKEESLTLAIKIRNVSEHNCTFSPNRVVFSAFAGDRHYLADLELNGDILTDQSLCILKNEEPVLILSKAHIGPWDNLLKQKIPNVSFDFEHWEDYEDNNRFPIVASCAKNIYTAVNEDVDSSENSDSESD